MLHWNWHCHTLQIRFLDIKAQMYWDHNTIYNIIGDVSIRLHCDFLLVLPWQRLTILNCFQGCLLCTLLSLNRRSASMVWINMVADDKQLYLFCGYDDTQTQLLFRNSNTASETVINGCRLTTCGLIPRRRSSCGLIPGTASADKEVVLGTDTIKASKHVWVIGVTMSSDLSLEKHVSALSAACFFQLRQICSVQQWLLSSNTHSCICDISSRLL